jgi:hypothetical protein
MPWWHFRREEEVYMNKQEYKFFVEGVHLNDQTLQRYKIERKGSTGWCIKLFRRLLNISERSTFMLYGERQNM